MKFRLFSLSVLLAFLPFYLLAQISPDLQARLDKTLDSMRIRIKSAAISGAMVLPDGNIWTSASGTASENPVSQAEPEQLYLIGSVTKTLISAAILQLAEGGQIKLDDKISKWIDPHIFIDSSITITHLLRHQSGLYDVLSNQALNVEMLTHQQMIFEPWTVITQYLQPALFAPGAQWSYSNTNYFLLGIIIQKISGQPYYEYLRTHFFEPFSLGSFSIPAFEAMDGDVCHVWLDTNGDQLTEDAHDFYANYLALNSMAGAAGGYYAKSSDLARWIYLFIRGEVVGMPWVAEAQKTVYASGVPNGTYGLGLMKKAFLGFTGYGHGGDLGYSASAWYFPEKQVSIAVLNNDAKNNSWALVPVIQALLKTYNAWASTTSTVALSEDTHFMVFPNPATDVINIQLPAFTENFYGNWQITDNNGRAMITSTVNTQNKLNKIDISALPSGTYHLLLQQNGALHPICKFIKQ